MMSLTFGLFTQVSGLGPLVSKLIKSGAHGPLVSVVKWYCSTCCALYSNFSEISLFHYLKNMSLDFKFWKKTTTIIQSKLHLQMCIRH